MIRNVREINWDYVGDSVPAFLTLIMIPLTYNIAYGVIAGVASYVLINGTAWLLLKISGGRIVPPSYDLAERWAVPPGGIIPGWIKYLMGRDPSHDAINIPMGQPQDQIHSLDDHTKGSLAMSELSK